MKKLKLNQMEILLGGQTQSAADANDISEGKMTWGCAGAIFGTALAFAGLVTATGGSRTRYCCNINANSTNEFSCLWINFKFMKKNKIKTIAILSLLLAGVMGAYIAPTIFKVGNNFLEKRELVGSCFTLIMCLLTSIAMFFEYFKPNKNDK